MDTIFSKLNEVCHFYGFVVKFYAFKDYRFIY